MHNWWSWFPWHPVSVFQLIRPLDKKFDEGNCQLLGPFSLIVQLALGAAAISSLVVKRYRETHQRPIKVWMFDVMKQILGAIGLHFFNVLASILFSSADEPGVDDNPCVWYFLNVLLDTTIGVPILWFCLHVVHSWAAKLHVKNIVSGEYGRPPRWSVFFKQASLYMIALIGMKIMLYIFVWWTPFLDDLGAFLISWTTFDPKVQVGFVMLVFPVVMNTIQYYLIDSIIEAPEYGSCSSQQSWYSSQHIKPDEETNGNFASHESHTETSPLLNGST